MVARYFVFALYKILNPWLGAMMISMLERLKANSNSMQVRINRKKQGKINDDIWNHLFSLRRRIHSTSPQFWPSDGVIRPAAAILVRIVIVCISFCTLSLPSKYVPKRIWIWIQAVFAIAPWTSAEFSFWLVYFKSLNPPSFFDNRKELSNS